MAVDPLVYMLGGIGFLALTGVGLVWAGGDGSAAKATKRAQALAGAAPAEKRARTSAESQSVRRKQILENLKTLEKEQRKAKLTLPARLRQAGLSATPQQFWIASALAAVVLALPALVLTRSPLIALGALFVAGLGLPRWVLSMMAKMRMKKFTEEFPNAIDLIVRGVKSGLPVNDCLKVIGRESPEPLGAEFRFLTESMSMGLTTDQAMDKMYGRMPTSEVKFFAIVLSIQQKTGGNLAEALGNLSAVLRARKLMVEKIKALSGEAVASAFIIGALPPGIMTLVTVTTPAYMMPMFNDPRGHHMLMFGAVWMGLGIFVMRRMINFKF